MRPRVRFPPPPPAFCSSRGSHTVFFCLLPASFACPAPKAGAQLLVTLPADQHEWTMLWRKQRVDYAGTLKGLERIRATPVCRSCSQWSMPPRAGRQLSKRTGCFAEQRRNRAPGISRSRAECAHPTAIVFSTRVTRELWTPARSSRASSSAPNACEARSRHSQDSATERGTEHYTGLFISTKWAGSQLAKDRGHQLTWSREAALSPSRFVLQLDMSTAAAATPQTSFYQLYRRSSYAARLTQLQD